MKITKPNKGSLRWAGVNFELKRDSITIHQTEYLLSLPLPEGIGEAPSTDTNGEGESSILFSLPSSSRDIPEEPSPLLSAKDASSFRERLGCLSWVTRDTRPDLAQGRNQLSRHASAPSTADADLLLSLLCYARRTATSRVIKISHSDVPSTSSVIHPISWSDAALGTAGNAHLQTGWLLSLGSAILHWRSFSQQRVARSSTRAELYTAHDLVDFLECLLPALRCVWKAGIVSEVRVNSDDLLKLVSSEMPRPTERALLSVIQSLQLGVLERSLHTLVLH
uniref:Uncharacterized protein n=1 Tax=Chromera velia CCMP2878 TaxID=1169474 RepID=A0A0G4FP90_9ALVE|eukprot:Cvel_17876.t1-p1 / transcript=Cvel_17876.t1 / gene=Cvel_17876 / organism=Chromera_velia_CCMP2878 / gene_product=hypothetical protein / transcript_product=hypothetical protein / location=Cvel_scaffold1450:9911-10747(-) / protein_length=279 / sequence_SO=supercontig / SO=protein_coding / is_pseudo=false